MAQIERYVLVDRDNTEGDHEFDDYQEAERAADENHAVIARIYTYEDSELVWTPDGSNQWPPGSAPTRTK